MPSLTNEERATLIAAADALHSGNFVHIHGYINAEGEKSHVTVHADASYDSVHERSLKKLNEIAADPNLTLPIVWNFYTDPSGMKHQRDKKGSGRVATIGFHETVLPSDPDFQEAVAKLRQSITNPREAKQEFDKQAKSTYENVNTGKTYFRNVLIHSKVVEIAGKYPETFSLRVNVIKNAIEKMLPMSQYRCYVLDSSETIELVVGKDENNHDIKKVFPRFEYVSIMHETLSSSSSSED